MADGTNTASIVSASGGRNLFSVFGDANKWEVSERNPPLPNAYEDADFEKERERVQHSIRAYNQQRDNHQLARWDVAGKQFSYTHWTAGFPSVNPATLGQGDYGTNPMSQNRVDYMRW